MTVQAAINIDILNWQPVKHLGQVPSVVWKKDGALSNMGVIMISTKNLDRKALGLDITITRHSQGQRLLT